MSMTWPAEVPSTRFRCVDTGGCKTADVTPTPCTSVFSMDGERVECCNEPVCPNCGGDVEKIDE